jgi:environmental stress-induced protein Ves
MCSGCEKWIDTHVRGGKKPLVKFQLNRLDPTQYSTVPWKNGAGTTCNLGIGVDGCNLSRTPIPAAGPFSDFTGNDRMQVLVRGSGLRLKISGLRWVDTHGSSAPHEQRSADGLLLDTMALPLIDVRQPFRPVCFPGEAEIASELVDGPVEVVNLIAERATHAIDLQVILSAYTLIPD